MTYIWTEKYRPEILSDIKSQDYIIENLKQDNFSSNLLLYGLPGTGKTSCIMTYARKFYGKSYKSMILELNASDNRGKDVVRNTIGRFVQTKSFFIQKKKMVILDEFDNMTHDAQELLISIMEKYPNIVYCFICNFINKVIPGIKSRCLKFRFNKISFEDTSNIMRKICKQEDIEITDKNLNDIYLFSNGDMRKAINILQNFNTNFKDLHKRFNYPSNDNIKDIYNLMLQEKNVVEIYKDINTIVKENDIYLHNLIDSLIKYINKNTLIKDIKKYMYVIKKLGEIDNRLHNDYNFKIQLYAILFIFKK